MSHADQMVFHSETVGTEKGLEEAATSGDLRRGNVNGGLSRSHIEQREVVSVQRRIGRRFAFVNKLKASSSLNCFCRKSEPGVTNR